MTTLVINWIIVSPYKCLNEEHLEGISYIIGATTLDKFLEEVELGNSGADASSLSSVSIYVPYDNGLAPKERFRPAYGNKHSERPVILQSMNELFRIAWDVIDNNLTGDQAVDKYFGHEWDV